MGKLNNVRVLVIGASGFLGGHLLTRLAREGARNFAVSRSLPAQPNRSAPAQWYRGCATNLEWLRGVIQSVQPEVIYQLASASKGSQELELVLPAFEHDLRTTVNTLIAAQESGVGRVILTRSLDEPDPGAAPASPYAAAKAASGLYGRMFRELYGLPVVMLRPFMVYGPGQKTYKVVPYTILAMLRGQAPRLTSGLRPLDWLYVDDLISAFITSATKPEAVGREIDLGSGVLLPVAVVADTIADLIPGAPKPSLGCRPDRRGEQVRIADLEPAATYLDWKPTTNLRDGLTATIEWYRRELRDSAAENDAKLLTAV